MLNAVTEMGCYFFYKDKQTAFCSDFYLQLVGLHSELFLLGSPDFS